MPPPLLPLLAIVAFFSAVLLGAVMLRARQDLELRTRLLEVFALAAARGLPLLPLLERAVAEHRGRARRRLERIRTWLAGGATLGTACAAAGRGLFPRHVVGALRAAEGSAALPAALDAAATESIAAQSLRHRVLVLAIYPAVLGLAFWVLLLPAGQYARSLSDALSLREGRLFPLASALGLAAVAALGVWLAAWLLLRRLCVLPGPRLLASERLLRSLAPHLAAGVPLSAALRRIAPACGNRAMAAGARDAAAELEAGRPLKEACESLPLPRFVGERLAAQEAQLREIVPALAEECGRRHRALIDRLLRWLHPVALLLFGALAGLCFAGQMDLLDRVRETVLW